jgi:hypothetical protein
MSLTHSKNSATPVDPPHTFHAFWFRETEVTSFRGPMMLVRHPVMAVSPAHRTDDAYH